MATATTTGSLMGELPPQAVVFHDVTWNDYEDMLRLVGERPIRVTYDQGTMEVFMSSLGQMGEKDLHINSQPRESAILDAQDIAFSDW